MRNYIIDFLLSLLLIIFVSMMFLLMLHASAIATDNPNYEDPDISGPYLVNVAFPNLEDYMKATGTKWVDPEVLTALFRDNGRDLGKKKIYLISFDCAVTSEQARRWMNQHNFYPTTLLPLFALGIDVSESFLRYPIVALGSTCHDYRGELCVPQIWQYWGKKKMSLVPYDPAWPAYTRFAAVKYEKYFFKKDASAK